MARQKNLSHKWLGKKSSPKARPRESIHEIRAAGGLNKVEPGSVPGEIEKKKIEDFYLRRIFFFSRKKFILKFYYNTIFKLFQIYLK